MQGYQLIFQQKLYRPEKSGRIYLKWWKGKTYNQNYSAKQGSHSDLNEKNFTDKQKITEFSTTRPALKQMLKELL